MIAVILDLASQRVSVLGEYSVQKFVLKQNSYF